MGTGLEDQNEMLLVFDDGMDDAQDPCNIKIVFGTNT